MKTSAPRIFIFLVLWSILLDPTSLFAQKAYSPETNKNIQEVERSLSGWLRMEGDSLWTIKQRMETYQVPAVSIAVVKNYKLDWAKAYGYADVSEKRLATPQTLFQAASISKSLNAVGLLKLAQDKKIDLYADINNYLTSWKFPYDSLSKNKKISVANLLSHTAGLSVHGFLGYSTNEKLPTIIEVLNGDKPSKSPKVHSLFEPGLKSQYSGGGTTISQLLVTDVTKQTYEEYAFNNVLKPIGMMNSFYTQSPAAEQKKQLSTAYHADFKPVEGKFHNYPPMAAAGLWTNPSDLAKFIIETQLSLEGKSNKILSQDMTKLMLTPYLDKFAALGVFIDEKGTSKYFQHAGANDGYRCHYYGSLEGGNGVVVMVNSDNGAIIPEIINSVASVYKWNEFYKPVFKKLISVPDDMLSAYVGEYELNPALVLTISQKGNQLQARATGQGKVDIYPEAVNKFFLKVVNAQLEFVKDENNKVSKVILYQDGRKMEGKKIK